MRYFIFYIYFIYFINKTHFIDKNTFINKICTKGNHQFSLDYFHNCKDGKDGKYGKHSICKLCRKIGQKKELEFNDIMSCVKCNIRKGIIDFYLNNPIQL